MKVIYEHSNGVERVAGEAMSVCHAKQLICDDSSVDASKVECLIQNNLDGIPEFICKIPDGIVITIGERYFWRDPDRDYSSGFVRAESVNGDLIAFAEGGLVAPRHELVKDKPEGLIDVFLTDDKGASEYCGKATSIQGALEVCADAYADSPDDYTCTQSEPLGDDGRIEYICTKQLPTTADLTLKISIRYLLNNTTEECLRNVLQLAAEHLSDMGLLTGETDAEVVDCGHEIF
jgi:hypothetical protein